MDAASSPLARNTQSMLFTKGGRMNTYRKHAILAGNAARIYGPKG